MADRKKPGVQPDFSITPKGATGCVIVIHEVWGLVRHTRDVCKRISKLGFATVAPNLYAGHDRILTPGNIQKAMEGVWKLSLEERRDKAKVARALDKKGVEQEIKDVAGLLYDSAFRGNLLKRALEAVSRAHSSYGDVTTLGFCLGGGLSLNCAVQSRHLRSAISFYGQPPTTEDVLKISVPILAVHANHDEIINRGVPGFVGAMLDGGKDLTLKTYPGTKHGFFNDTRAEVYDRTAAREAWDITRWFLERTIGRH
jgi:carboxymethylenebutenolidase